MISFADSPGNLFNALGKLGALVKNLKSYQSTQLTAMTNTTTGVVAQYNNESDLQAVMGSTYISILATTDSIIGGLAQNLAGLTVNRVVFRDNPQLNQTLTSSNTLASLLEIIRQMKQASATVLAMTIGATPTSFTGTGTGVITVSTKRPLDGKVLENSLAENLLFTCIRDSYLGNAIAGNETFSVTGVGQESDTFAFDWPLGSNCQTSLQAIDGNVDTGSGNLLTNSGFTDWTANVPDNFSLAVGVAGTDIYQETTIVLDSSGSSLAIFGDGVTQVELKQIFNDVTGTLVNLQPLTQYSCNIFARRDGIVPAAGILTIALVDNNDNIIQDQNGVDNSFIVNLTSLTTVFAAKNGVFRTPAVLPATMYLRLMLTTPLTVSRTVYLDRLSLGKMSQVYTSGPFVAVHSGGINFLQGDYGSCQITNSRGAGGTLSTWQTLLSQLFSGDIISNELLFPSSATPTISDGLIS